MKRCTDERGAVAVLLAILFSMALVFATAAGLSSLTRAGSRGELQRAADAGSLAGARSIPVADVGAALDYVNTPHLVDWPGGADPLEIACDQAAATAEEDDAISEEYAEPLTSASQHCEASYLSDREAVDRLQTCAESLLDEVPAVPTGPLDPLGPVLDPVLAALPSPTQLLHDRLANLTSALLRPGIRVELTRAVTGGPIEGALPADSGTESEAAVSLARRRFKNLIVIPVVDVLPALLGEPIDLNDDLADNHDEVINMIETVDAQFEESLATLSSALGWNLRCNRVFDGIRDDFNDVYNPGSGNPPAMSDVIEDLQATGEEAQALILGWANGAPLGYPDDPTGVLNIPFFDFVPVCLEGDVVLIGDAACTTRAPGSFRASLVQGEHEGAR